MAPPTSNALGKRPVSADDDDVDDLDDVLDDFTANTPVKSTPQTTTTVKATTAASPPPAASTQSPGPQDEEFVEQFAREMEAMLLGLDPHQVSSGPTESASASANNADAGEETIRDTQFLDALEEWFSKSMAGVPLDGDDVDKAEVVDESKDAFRKSRDEAAERLRKSDTELQTGPPADDDLAALPVPGSEDEKLLQDFLESMMGQLMNKEVLYEPLKELNDKFPSYLASNRDKLWPSDLERYQAQYACASEIIALFDGAGYKDDDPEMQVRITTLMSKMQEHGAPPAEIMGELPAGLDLGPDGAPQLPEGCVIG